MKNSDFKDSRLLEAFDFIDQKYIAEVADSLKFEKAAPMPAKGFNRRTWRHIAALAACVLLLGAVIPMMTYLLRNFGDIASWFPEDTTEDSNPLTEPETPPEETTTLPPETTEEETTADPETTACTHPNLTVSENMPTCTESATIQSYCSDCGYSDSKVLPPLGHDFVNGICTRCGEREEGSVSAGLEYKVYESYAVLVGIGTCTDTDIVIASEYNGLPVTTIGECALSDIPSLKSVTIPEGVETIMLEAFYHCTSLSEINFPSTLKTIGSRAFAECESLRTLRIPDSVKRIDDRAFEECRNLSELDLGTGVERILESAFMYCTSLKKIAVPGSVKEISNSAFAGNPELTDVTLSKGIEKLGFWIFSDCLKLEVITYTGTKSDWNSVFVPEEAFGNITIKRIRCSDGDIILVETDPKQGSLGLEYQAFGDYAVLAGIGTCTDPDIVIASEYQGLPVTEIWHEAFVGVKGMRSVKIPEGVRYIESHAFENCTDLREVYLPASLENVVGSLMTHGFVGCPAIETIEIAEGGKKYYSVDNCLIERETGTLVFGCGKSAIPADGSVKSIGEYAFNGCRNLVSLALPEGVIHIRTGAFSGCEALRTLTLPNSLVTIRQNAFENCTSLSSLTLPESVTEIYNGAFRGCSKLKSVTLPSSLTLIDSEAFLGTAIESIAIPKNVKELGAVFSECEKLTSVTLPEGFESFVGHTFSGCTSLKSITLPKSLKNIGMNTFYGCTALTDLRFAGTVAQWKSISKQEHWKEGAAFKVIHCSDGDVEVNEYDGSVGLQYSKSGNATIGYYMTLDGIGTCTDVDIVVASYYNGYPVKVIDNNAFNGQTHIKSIRLSDTVEIISYGAFRGCSSLESLYISASLKRIDSHVFWNCGNITKIEIDPNNEVFEGRNCIIEKSRKALVLGCRTTVIPSDGSVTRIDGLAFKDVIGLTSITIPEGVTLLSEDAFSGCPDLKSIHFSSTVDSFDLVSVMGCDALEVITVDPKNPRFYSSGNCVIEKATGTLLLGCGKSVIPNDGSIKKIGYYAFGGSNSLVSIVVPEGVTYIDGYAFASCESLKSVYLPDSLITLGYGVFCNSSALETVRIGKNLETIGSSVFDGCSKLNNLSFPKTLKRMGEMVFMECKSLTSVSFEGTGAEWNAIEKLELWNAAAGFSTVKCSDGVLELYEYDGSRGLQYIQYGAYAQLAGIGTCTDKDIVIASTYNGVPVVIIEPGVFKNNKNIRSVSIPNKVHYIGEDAFAFCTALSDIQFAGTVAQWKSISKQEHWNEGAAFKVIHCSDGDVEVNEYDGSRGLEYEIRIDSFTGRQYAALIGIGTCTDSKIVTATYYQGYPVTDIDGCAFDKISGITSITVSEGVTYIEMCAFCNCPDLRELHLPSTLMYIGDAEANIISGSNNIEVITVPKNAEYFYVDGNCLIEKKTGTLALGCKTSVIPTDGRVKEIGRCAFQSNPNVKNIVLPEGITKIDQCAFAGCKNLKSIVFPKSLTEIGPWAFQNCTSLEKINLTEKVTVIYYEAFHNCEKLAEVVLPGSLEKIYWSSFGLCPALNEIKYLGTKAEWNSVDIDISWNTGSAITVIHCSDGDVNLRDHDGTQGLVYKFSADGTYAILVGSVSGTDKKIVVATTYNGVPVKKIGSRAFAGNASLTEIVIPEGVTVIENEAFYVCGLQKVTLPSTLEWIQDMAFARCSKLAQINIPDGVREIGQNAFKDCVNLTSLTLGAGVELIEEGAFENCTSLGYVKFPKSLRLLANDAFAGCTSLTSVHYAGTIQEWNSVDSTGRDYGNSHVWYEGIPAGSIICSNGDVDITG